MIKIFLPFLVLCFGFSSSYAETEKSKSNDSRVDNSLIIIIHGDGDYLFHNRAGEAFLADEAVLSKSITTAEQLTNSEVFIIHQKRKESSFLFFSEDDLDLYFFKNGRLLESSSAQRKNFQFDDEKRFYDRYASPSSNKILLYYGHEVPVGDGYGYSASYKDQPFNISIFSEALDKFSQGDNFNLVVLSTCNNGSPEVIKELSSKADYIIASPENLHLSYMNPIHLRRLSRYSTDMEDIVVEFARSSFNELKKTTETVTAISAYKTADLSDSILELHTFTQSKIENQLKLTENCDCKEIIRFDEDEASRGVIVFYNPPAFGREQFKRDHSGWGCRKETAFSPSSAIDKIIQVRRSGLNQSRDQEK